jgi:hypothetical protein
MNNPSFKFKIIPICAVLILGAVSNADVSESPNPSTGPSACAHCEQIEAQETKLLNDIDFYQSRKVKSEKYDAKASLLKDLGETAKRMSEVLHEKSVSDETLERG